MEFFKENPGIRVLLILISVVIALFLVFTGWQMTGQMGGLIKMVIGVGFLLVALKIYNITFILFIITCYTLSMSTIFI